MMRTNSVSFLALLLLTGALACGGDERRASGDAATRPAPTATAASLTAEQLGELGARIRKSPERADELLREHNLTRESFEQAIRAVTEDAEASKRYASAYKKAGA